MGRSAPRSQLAYVQLMLIALLSAAAFPSAWAQQPQPEASGNKPDPAYQDDLAAKFLSHLKAPLPPREDGCFRLDQDHRWESIPCASEEYLREHPVRRPFFTNSIQSTPNPGNFLPRNSTGFFATPFALGS